MSSLSEIETMDMDQSDEISYSFVMQMACGSALPMVLRAAIELDLLELIKKAEPNAISASEIAVQLPTNNPDAADMLDRLLRFLTAFSVLNCTIKSLPDGGGFDRCYSLTPLCKFLTKNEDGVSLAPVLTLIQDKILMETWYHLKDAILGGGIPFNRAHGMSAFEYLATDPRFNKIFNQAMSNNSTIIVKKILEIYNGFEGLNSLVDVGGGTGVTLNMIVSKYPSIKGINYDLPHVIQDAPSYQGVEHIGGDMFVSVPEADAIFMKWICHDWSDAHCKKLLKNCYESLPKNGKVIVAEYIYPESEDQTSELAFRNAAQADLIVLAIYTGGKERTEKEFRALAKEAGFNEFHKISHAFNIWIMELCK